MPGRLLIVEDDDSIGYALHDSLSAHGYMVDWRCDVATATELLGRTIPDLVFARRQLA